MAWIWLVAGIALIAAEMLSGEFWLLLIGAGALAGAGAALSGSALLAGAVFAVVSIGLLVFVRPALKRKLMSGTGMQTYTERLIGKQAVVLSTVDSEQGLVKLDGEDWTARAQLPGEVIEAGQNVTVVEISGATAVVSAERLIE